MALLSFPFNRSWFNRSARMLLYNWRLAPINPKPLTNVGLDAFVATGHVHELHDIVAGLSIPIHDDDTSIYAIH